MSESTGSGYEDEPREHFEPLPPHLHSLFYHHERLDGDLDAEYHYYRNAFAPNCRHILELGCGTSLLSSRLAAQGMRVTGIDLDPGMLRLPSGQRTGATAQMDMCDLGFRPCFHGVLIAHNTLNLLVDETRIRYCLASIRQVLIPPSILVAHLHVFDDLAYPADEQRMMQFHLYDLPTGEKIVKESITSRSPENNMLHIEQRYKYRNFTHPERNRNYRQYLDLALFTTDQWLSIFEQSGFTPIAQASSFSDADTPSPATLIITATTSNDENPKR